MHSQDVKQRRLPGPGGAHNRNKLARLNVEIDPPQHVSLRRTVGESFFDAPQTDHEIAPKPLSASSRLASRISRRSAPASSSTINPSKRWTMRSACWA